MNHQASKFPLGRILCTPGVIEDVHPEDLQTCLQRHAQGDWGNCCQVDWKGNELSLQEGFRLFSVYRDRNGTKFWIITEADRSATTMLLPDEY